MGKHSAYILTQFACIKAGGDTEIVSARLRSPAEHCGELIHLLSFVVLTSKIVQNSLCFKICYVKMDVDLESVAGPLIRFDYIKVSVEGEEVSELKVLDM